jgi:hypothetical protein
MTDTVDRVRYSCLCAYLIMHCAVKTTWGSGVIAPQLLNSAVDWGEWPGSRPDRSTPGEITPRTDWIGCWMAPESVWSLRSTEKSLAPAGNRTLAV